MAGISSAPRNATRNELTLIWGVESLIIPQAETTEEMLKLGEKILLESGSVEKGEMIVIMAGRLSGLGLSSSVTVFTVGGTNSASGIEVAQPRR